MLNRVNNRFNLRKIKYQHLSFSHNQKEKSDNRVAHMSHLAQTSKNDKRELYGCQLG